MLQSRNQELEINFYGANILFSKKILIEGIKNFDEVVESTTDTGLALLHYASDDIERERLSADEEKTQRTKCCSMKLTSLSNQDGKDEDSRHVIVRHNVLKDCEHGKAETRMHYAMSQEIQKRSCKIPESKTTLLQISKDCENVSLALFAMAYGGFQGAQNIYVKVGNTFFDIRKLISAVNEAGMSPMAVGPLYALSGNDFQPAWAVASWEAMIRTYCSLSYEIGDLCTVLRVRKLYYYTFLCT